MDQQKIEAIAQNILSLSDEERQLLEQKIAAADRAANLVDSASVSKLNRVAELAQEIQSFEARYSPALYQSSDDSLDALKGEIPLSKESQAQEGNENSAHSFLN